MTGSAAPPASPAPPRSRARRPPRRSPPRSRDVAPLTVGAYFQKINCFCFTDQRMKAGERREMAVVFYLDPALAQDAEHDDLNTITLSYTFYPVRAPQHSALAAGRT